MGLTKIIPPGFIRHPNWSPCLLQLGLGVLVLLNCLDALAQAPRVLPEGTRPNDVRLQPLKDLDGYFPFHPCQSPAEWKRRADQLRRQMLVALGLWPMPPQTPPTPVIHGKIDRS